MILNELISEIREYRPDWTNRFIIHQINTKRALLLKNRLNQGVLINDVVKQTLQNVEMAVASTSELLGYDSGSKILQSRRAIPTLIARHNKPAFLAVRTPDILSTEFNVVPKENVRFTGNGRYNKRSIFVFPYNSHLFLKLSRTNPKIALIDTLSVEGVFEDPTEVIIFNKPELIGRDIWFEEYPINAADWNYVKGMILGNERAQEENIQG